MNIMSKYLSAQSTYFKTKDIISVVGAFIASVFY